MGLPRAHPRVPPSPVLPLEHRLTRAASHHLPIPWPLPPAPAARPPPCCPSQPSPLLPPPHPPPSAPPWPSSHLQPQPFPPHSARSPLYPSLPLPCSALPLLLLQAHRGCPEPSPLRLPLPPSAHPGSPWPCPLCLLMKGLPLPPLGRPLQHPVPPLPPPLGPSLPLLEPPLPCPLSPHQASQHRPLGGRWPLEQRLY